MKREGNKKVNKVSAENKGNEVKPNVKQNIKQEEKVPNRFEEYKAFLKERELEKEREKEREREIKRAKREKEVAEKTKKKDDRNVIHNEDLLEQIERLNRNRAQMKESMEKSKNRQSKH